MQGSYLDLLSEEEKMRAIQAEYRTNLSEFIRGCFRVVDPNASYKHNWHIDLIAEYLQACRDRQITRLIINIPPRFLKSISVSVAFPAYLLGHNPGEQIMCASYSSDLSMKHSVDCRAVIQTEWYKWLFPHVQLLEDQNTKAKYVTTERGFRIATSTGGTVTGEGGNFLIVDDPLSTLQARSTAERDNANIWFDQSFSTRLNDKEKGVIIVIMQRLHQDDLTGHLLEKGGWEHLKIQLISEQKKIFDFGNFKKTMEEGELLHPQRMGAELIEKEKRALGAFAFSGQYMQNPSPTGGGEFMREWLMFYKGKLSSSAYNCYIMIDPASSKKKSSDYTCMCVVGLGQDRNMYVLDIVRDKLNLREREDALFQLHAKYKPKYVLYERYGMQLDAEYMKKAMDERNYRFFITEIGGSLSKEDRIRRLIPYFYEQRIYLPEKLVKTNYEGIVVDLIEEFIEEEYLAFPISLHDDMLDALSRLLDATLEWPGGNNVDYHALYGGR